MTSKVTGGARYERATAAAVEPVEAGSGRYVFVWSASVIARLLRPLAQCLKERHGIETVLLTDNIRSLPSREAHDFDPAAFAEIVAVEDWLRPRSKADLLSAEAMAEAANTLERRLGVNIVEMIRTDRHIGANFVTGAVFPRSRYGTSADFGQSLDIGLRLSAGFEQLLNKYRPLVLLSSAAPIAPASLVRVGMAMGIPMRWFIPSPLEKHFYWTGDVYASPLGLRSAFDTLLATSKARPRGEPLVGDQDDGPRLPTPSRPRLYFAGVHKRATVRYLAFRFYRAIRREVGHHLYRRYRVYGGGYWLGDTLRSIAERWRWTRRILREKPVMDTVPPGLPFVFFPLHLEPEATLMSEAQMADNQLTIVDWLAKTAPPGWYVVIKEHPGSTAPRPKGFWERVRAYPNVIIAATLESAESIIESAKAVADIHGSPGIQAAVSGRPVIAFNRYYAALVMPHVLLATSYEETGAALRKIRDGEIPDVATRRLAGQAFLDAVRECSFEVHDQHLIAGVPGLHKFDLDEVDTLVESLIASLKTEPDAAALVT